MSHIKNWIDLNPEQFEKVNEAPDDSNVDNDLAFIDWLEEKEQEQRLADEALYSQYC